MIRSILKWVSIVAFVILFGYWVVKFDDYKDSGDKTLELYLAKKSPYFLQTIVSGREVSRICETGTVGIHVICIDQIQYLAICRREGGISILIPRMDGTTNSPMHCKK